MKLKMIRYYFWLLILSLSSTMSLMACELPVADFEIDPVDGRLVLLMDKSQNADSITWYGVNMDKDVFVAGSNLKLFPENNTAAVDLGGMTSNAAGIFPNIHCTSSNPPICSDIFTLKIVARNECGTSSITNEVVFSEDPQNSHDGLFSSQTVKKTITEYTDDAVKDSVVYGTELYSFLGNSSLTILKPSSHSQVEYVSDYYFDINLSNHQSWGYIYKPKKGFVGNDTAVLIIRSNYINYDTVTIIITVDKLIVKGPILPFEQIEMKVRPKLNAEIRVMDSCFIGLKSKGGEFVVQQHGKLANTDLLKYYGDSVFYAYEPLYYYSGTDNAEIIAKKDNISKPIKLIVNLTNIDIKWTKIYPRPEAVINAIFQFGADTLLVGTQGKGLYISTDDGQHWGYHSLDGTIIKSIARQGSTLFVGTELSGIYTADIRERVWQWKNEPFPGHTIYDIKVNNHTVYAATGGNTFMGGIYISIDEGRSWNSLIGTIRATALEFGSNGRMFISLLSGGTPYYTDDYSTLHKVDILSSYPSYYVETIGKDSVAFIGEWGPYLSVDNGQTVKEIESVARGTKQNFFKVSGLYYRNTLEGLIFADNIMADYCDCKVADLRDNVKHLIRHKNTLIANCENGLYISSIVPPSPLSLNVTIRKPFSEKTFDGRIDIEVNGGTYPYSYRWSNSKTSEYIKDVASGDYNVTVVDAQGLRMTQTITVEPQVATIPLSIVATIRKATLAGSADGAIDITVVGGTQPYTFKWDNNDTSADIARVQAGKYTVTVTDTDGKSLTEIFPVEVQYPGNYSLSGTLQYDGSALSDASVVLYSNVSGYYMPYLIAEPSENGSYSFASLPAADYVLYAVPRSNDAIAPTYAFHSIRFSNALQLHLSGNTSHYEIELQPNNAIGNGAGRISGVVNSEYDVVKSNGIFNTSATGTSARQGISNVTILVYKDGKLVAWDISDSMGGFMMEGLPNGTYVVSVEIPGFGLSEETVVIDDVYNAVNSRITITDKGPVSDIQIMDITPEILFYPNPVSDIIYLTEKSSEITQIRTLSGELIIDQHQGRVLAVDQLIPGTYLLTISVSGVETTQLFIKE